MHIHPSSGIWLPAVSGGELIVPGTVIRIEAISNYSKIYFTNGRTLVTSKLLRWFDDQLASHGFVRTHRTHLVNKNFIHHYIKGRCGKVILQNGECIDVAKRKRNHFLQAWNTAA